MVDIEMRVLSDRCSGGEWLEGESCHYQIWAWVDMDVDLQVGL